MYEQLKKDNRFRLLLVFVRSESDLLVKVTSAQKLIVCHFSTKIAYQKGWDFLSGVLPGTIECILQYKILRWLNSLRRHE